MIRLKDYRGTFLEILEGQVSDLLEIGPLPNGALGDRVNVLTMPSKHVLGNGEMVLQVEAGWGGAPTEEDCGLKNRFKKMVLVKIG